MRKAHRTRLERRPAAPLPHWRRAEWLRTRLLDWWACHAREFPWRLTRDEYRIAVTEVLLQQTSARAVAAAYPAFFDRFHSWSALDEACEEELRATIQPLGLARQRAARLKRLAGSVVDRGGSLPADRDGLEETPGIGPYVAGAVLAARGEPEPLLDVNMARLMERLFGIRERADIREDPWLQHASRRLFPGLELGWAVLDFAALVCRPRPRCEECPLRSRCAQAALGELQAQETSTMSPDGRRTDTRLVPSPARSSIDA